MAKPSTRGKPPRSAAGTTPPPTTAQSLGALLKSARDIMRKDKGLNGDLDRLPMLTWIMFLKFLDDLEIGEGRTSWPGRSSGRRLNPLLAGGIGRPRPTASRETNSLPSFNRKNAACPMGKKASACSGTCARSPVRTATTGAT